MITADEILRLPKEEKLRVMGLLWENLTSSPDEIRSPRWHAEELAATEQRVTDGTEKPLGWSDAKAILRAERA